LVPSGYPAAHAFGFQDIAGEQFGFSKCSGIDRVVLQPVVVGFARDVGDLGCRHHTAGFFKSFEKLPFLGLKSGNFGGFSRQIDSVP
jgi:hypothetical protein